MAKKMPEDVKQLCLWIAKGYDRRRAEYQAGPAKGTKAGDRRRRREWERLEAVDQALLAVTADIEADEVRAQLRRAILLNVESGHRYPYELLALDAVSRADFYRRKTRFLQGIAGHLGLM